MRQYLDYLKKVKDEGIDLGDRTKTGTRNLFGELLEFDLQEGFPLQTTKKIHLPSVIGELLWFLSGDTNTAELKRLGIRIWDEWATEYGELGPIYGYQWRSWRGYNRGEEIDQIQYVINNLNLRPESRRTLVSTWNVGDLPDESISPQDNVDLGKMALAPCHVLFQFFPMGDRLDCVMYQRSQDIILGAPFNIASYALLLHMVAQQTGYRAGKLKMMVGVAHIYKDHLEDPTITDEILSRTPKALPTLKIKRIPESIFDYKVEDFEFINYNPDPAVKAKIAV